MRKIRIAVLMAACTFTLSAFAFQNPGPPQGGPMGRGMLSVDDQVKILSERLGLTDDQKTKVKTILEDSRAQIQNLMKDESMAREDKMEKMRSIRESTNSKIRDVLTDDQKKKFDDMGKERRDRMRQRQGGDNPPSAPPK